MTVFFFSNRDVECYDSSCHQDPEARHHVSGGFPSGSAGHEEAKAREVGAAVRRGLWRTHLHRDRVHEPRWCWWNLKKKKKKRCQNGCQYQTVMFWSFVDRKFIRFPQGRCWKDASSASAGGHGCSGTDKLYVYVTIHLNCVSSNHIRSLNI